MKRPRAGRIPTALAAFAGLVLVSFVAAAAPAAKAEPPPVFEGTWIVTLGTQMVFHGRWAAQALPNDRDTVQGSFSMLNEAGEVVGGGTWSARRAKRGFQGKWSSRGANGATYTGSFNAHLPDFKGKTLEDMFAATKTQQISGFFRTSGNSRGAWYFKGDPPRD